MQHCCPARLAVGVLFAHGTDRDKYVCICSADPVVLGLHGRTTALRCPLDVSL
ncbi:hypothetical protein AWT69_004679 [Pseudomonas putida]|nr:hypothetical protein AWT69_004679 [Pseudomonas putida]